MTIQDFLGKRNVNITELAAQLGYNRQHLYAVLTGRVRASKRLANQLANASEGKITADDLFAAYKDRQQAK